MIVKILTTPPVAKNAANLLPHNPLDTLSGWSWIWNFFLQTMVSEKLWLFASIIIDVDKRKRSSQPAATQAWKRRKVVLVQASLRKTKDNPSYNISLVSLDSFSLVSCIAQCLLPLLLPLLVLLNSLLGLQQIWPSSPSATSPSSSTPSKSSLTTFPSSPPPNSRLSY